MQTKQTPTKQESRNPDQILIDYIQVKETADGWVEKMEEAKPEAIKALKTFELQKFVTGSHEASIVPTGGQYKTGEAAKALGFDSVEALVRFHLALKGINADQFLGKKGETIRIRDL